MDCKPKLRFPEFSGEWGSDKLKNISKEINRTSKKFDIEVLTISAGKGFITQKERWNKVIAGNSLKKYTVLKKNEFSYNRGNSKTFPYGCLYRLKDQESALVPNVYRSFSFEEQNPLFYEQFFIGGHIDRQLNKLISSSARMDGLLNISKKDFFDVEVSVPKIQEQEKIGAFLSKLDGKIEKLEKKQELWETYKKGIMQQIFSQKLRFKDENGEEYPDWEEKTLGKISKINTGKKDLQDKVDNGRYPFFVRSDNVERINTYSFDGEAILIPGDGRVGEVYHYINGKFDYHQRVYKISDFEDHVLGKYIYYYLKKNFLKQAIKNSVRATVNSLRLPTFKEMDILLPKYPEQKKITNYLSSIEFKIDCLKREIIINKKFKKGLLQQMFC